MKTEVNGGAKPKILPFSLSFFIPFPLLYEEKKKRGKPKKNKRILTIIH
jgi:hypothetical protein